MNVACEILFKKKEDMYSLQQAIQKERQKAYCE